MDVSKLKVGDKVRIRSRKDLEKEFGTKGGYILSRVHVNSAMVGFCGQEMTIKSILKREKGFTVTFVENGFFWSDDVLEPVDKNYSIIIYKKGDKVIALDKSTGESVRIASYDDFYKDADAAFKRLLKKNFEPKEYNDEIICVEANTDLFTKGKVYKVVNGYVTNDAGVKEGKFSDLDSLNRCLMSKFIKLAK